jgi:hypothetical protein
MVLFFVFSFVLLAVPLTFTAIYRLRELEAPFKMNIGIAICYLGLLSVVSVTLVNMDYMANFVGGITFLGTPTRAMLNTLEGEFSLLAMYIISFRIHLITKEAQGISMVGMWKKPWVIVLNIIMAYLIVGIFAAGVNAALNIHSTAPINWVVVITLQMFLARLVFAVYFGYSYFKLAKIAHQPQHSEETTTSKALRRVLRKQLPLSLFILITLFCSLALAFSAYKAGDFFYLSGLINANLALNFLLVLTITDTSASKMDSTTAKLVGHVNNAVDQVFCCMNGGVRSSADASTGHSRQSSSGPALSPPKSPKDNLATQFQVTPTPVNA